MAWLRVPDTTVARGMRGLTHLLEVGLGLHQHALRNAAAAVEADRDAARVRREVASAVRHVAMHAERQTLSRAN
jgi:hypothetical protein